MDRLDGPQLTKEQPAVSLSSAHSSLRGPSHRNHLPSDKLTEREFQIAVLLAAEFLTVAEIAKQLGISYQTMKNHDCTIHRKLNVSNRAGVREWYLNRGKQPQSANAGGLLPTNERSGERQHIENEVAQ